MKQVDSVFYFVVFVVFAAMLMNIFGVIWHVVFARKLTSLLKATSLEKAKLVEDRKLFDRLLVLLNDASVKADVAKEDRDKLIAGAAAVASNLKDAHERADKVKSSAPTGKAADAAARK